MAACSVSHACSRVVCAYSRMRLLRLRRLTTARLLFLSLRPLSKHLHNTRRAHASTCCASRETLCALRRARRRGHQSAARSADRSVFLQTSSGAEVPFPTLVPRSPSSPRRRVVYPRSCPKLPKTERLVRRPHIKCAAHARVCVCVVVSVVVCVCVEWRVGVFFRRIASTQRSSIEQADNDDDYESYIHTRPVLISKS